MINWDLSTINFWVRIINSEIQQILYFAFHFFLDEKTKQKNQVCLRKLLRITQAKSYALQFRFYFPYFLDKQLIVKTFILTTKKSHTNCAGLYILKMKKILILF